MTPNSGDAGKRVRYDSPPAVNHNSALLLSVQPLARLLGSVVRPVCGGVAAPRPAARLALILAAHHLCRLTG
jgi:hypothetical protein